MDEQKKRRNTEEHFRAAFQHSRDILYRVNIQTGQYEYFSPSLKDITGRDPEEVAELGNMGYGILVHPEDLEHLGLHLLRLTDIRGDENKTYTVEYRFKHRDGHYICLSDNHTVLRDARGLPEYFIGNLRDVTERRRMEQALHDSDARLRAMLDNGIDLINLLDEHGNIIFESSAAGPPVDYSDDYESTSGFYWIHPDDRACAIAVFQDLAQKPGARISIELRIRNSDGTWRVYECRAVNMLHDPRVRGIVLNSHDITERRAAEQALRDSDIRFRAMLDNGTDLITLLDEKGNILFESPSSGRLLGYTDDFTGTPGFEWIHPDDRSRVIESFQNLAATPGARDVREIRIRRIDGTWRLYECRAVNMLHDPRIRGIILNSHDITRRKLAEDRLRALSHELFKMHEREREHLSRELHDELGQKLTGIALAFEGFAQQAGADPDFVQNLKNILENANTELKNIYKGLRPVALDRLGLSVALEDLVREFNDSGQFSVRAEVASLQRDDVSPDAAINIYRVLQEALTNAARHARAGNVFVRLQRGGDSLTLTVQDDGRGFDFEAESMDRGIGLFSMKERVALLGGTLDIISQPGKGVTIKAVFKIGGKDMQQETQTP